MIVLILRLTAWFFFYIFLQVAVLNEVDVFGGLHPYVYWMFLLKMPPLLPGWGHLLAAFVLGFTVDMFMMSYGLHAGASVLAAMVLLRSGAQGVQSASESSPEANGDLLTALGFRRSVLLISIIVLAHHTFLLFAEAFGLRFFWSTLWNIFLNFFISILVAFITESISRLFKARRVRYT